MSSRTTSGRLGRSLMVVTILTLGYGAVRMATSPFLDVEPTKYRDPGTGETFVSGPPPQLNPARWFPGDSWVQSAKEQYFDGGRCLYCDKSELINNGSSVVLKPVAIQWLDEGAEEGTTPVTLIAESAQLDLESPLTGQSTRISGITSGFVFGQVRIRGPRGLRIVGHAFQFNEKSMLLHSSKPIQFAWEGHQGTASQGLEVHFRRVEKDDGQISIGEPTRIQLLGKVDCRIRVPPRRRNEDELKLNISAARGFRYDATTQTGTFYGIRESGRQASQASAPLVPEKHVWVRHINPDGSVDRLVCPELVLTFRRDVGSQDGLSQDGELKLEHLRAWGRRVVFHSRKHDVLVDGNDFEYAVDERRIDIRNTTIGKDRIPGSVRVLRGDVRMLVPHIRILHTSEGGRVRRIECNGPGSIAGQAPTSGRDGERRTNPDDASPAFAARWLESLIFQVAPDERTQTVTLNGKAAVAQTDRKISMAAGKIRMLLVNGDQPEPGVETASDIDFGALDPQRIVATDDVTLTSPEGTGRIRETLTINFEETTDLPVRTVSTSNSRGPRASGRQETAQNSFAADSLDARVTFHRDGDDRRTHFRDLWLKGNVTVTRRDIDPKRSFTASGNQLYAANGLSENREIHLFGDPAQVTTDSRDLEGPRIDLTELNGRPEANVIGSGRIRMLTSRGLDGRPLPEPMPLDIYWSDRMVFQARTVDFLGNVRVVMSDNVTQDLQMLCSGLTVHFTKDVSLSAEDGEGSFTVNAGSDQAEEGPIERIECHHRVEVHMEQFTDGLVSGRHHGEFADLTVNLISGDFHAVGPGFLESVTPDRDGALQGSAPVTARANAAAQTSETAFVHLKTTFIGELTGNLHRREARLDQNVLALVTPARRVDEAIDLESIPNEDLPPRAGILGAEELTMSAVGSPDAETQSFSIVARSSARLESRSIAARADVITYDHAKEQFIIRADGEGTVTVNHRSGPGGQFNRLSGNRFEYYRRTDRLTANEIGGLNLSR